MLIYENEDQVRNIKPDLSRLTSLDSFAVIVTAPGKGSDFVSRFFAPKAGIPEDPVPALPIARSFHTGPSASDGRNCMPCRFQQRGGELFCEDRGERVLIGGRAVTYLSGTIHLS